MPPRTVPLLFVRRGELVRPEAPRGWRPIARTDQAALAEARRLFSAFEALYVWDVDGNEYGEANLDFYQALERAHVAPWVDGGCRKLEDVMDLFLAGAEAVTVQLRHMEPRHLRELSEMAEADLHLGLTLEGGGLEKGIRPREVIEFARQIRAAGVVLYEGESFDLRRAQDVAHELQRNDVPVTWVARGGSAPDATLRDSERLASLVRVEGPGP